MDEKEYSRKRKDKDPSLKKSSEKDKNNPRKINTHRRRNW